VSTVFVVSAASGALAIFEVQYRAARDMAELSSAQAPCNGTLPTLALLWVMRRCDSGARSTSSVVNELDKRCSYIDAHGG
jgi:hypothetical protein